MRERKKTLMRTFGKYGKIQNQCKLFFFAFVLIFNLTMLMFYVPL